MIIEAVGYRHLGERPDLSVGEKIEFEFEPTNLNDPNAILIMARGYKVGWVNRLQTKAFSTWIEAGRVKAYVDRLNGTTAQPRVYIFVAVV
ncbi:MAG: hypothetical protein EON59_11760 [Alphaproteobacteria bacterium]|nr:MAG: hypothetical protein EON59_11760 [Alphaproteobacteria bacterium]